MIRKVEPFCKKPVSLLPVFALAMALANVGGSMAGTWLALRLIGSPLSFLDAGAIESRIGAARKAIAEGRKGDGLFVAAQQEP